MVRDPYTEGAPEIAERKAHDLTYTSACSAELTGAAPSAGVTGGFGRLVLAFAPLDVGDRDSGTDRVAHDRGLALGTRRGFQIVGLVLTLDVEFGSRLDLGGPRGGLGHPGLAAARPDRPDAKYLLSKRPHLLQALGSGKTKKRLSVGVAAVLQAQLSDDNVVVRYLGGARTGQLFLKLGDPSLQLADLQAFVAKFVCTRSPWDALRQRGRVPLPNRCLELPS
jgi:hypothetical protein